MIKNKYFRKKIILGSLLALLLGVLLLNSPLTVTAGMTPKSVLGPQPGPPPDIPQPGPPPDIPQPGVPFPTPGNGSLVYLIPGENLTLKTPSGVSINLTVGESVNISIKETTINPAGNLPDNVPSLGRFLQIEFGKPDVETSATLSMPYDDGDIPPEVAEEYLYFAFYEVSTGEWQGVPSRVDTDNNIIYASTTHFSTWTVLGPQPGPPNDIPRPGVPFLTPGNGSSVTLIPGENLTLKTPSGVSINLTVGESVNISINETTINPAGNLPDNVHFLGRFLQIEFGKPDVETSATLSMPYNDEDIPPEVAEEHLYFAFYNASTGEWQDVPSWVDTDNNMVYARTTHFSTWTVLGKMESSKPTDSTTTSQQPTFWLETNVKAGFLGITMILTLVLTVIVVLNRRQK